MVFKSSLMKKRNVEMVAIHFDNRPLTDFRPLEKTKRLLKKLGIKKLYIIEHGKNQLESIKNTTRKYNCILCRRFMFRIAEKVAKKEKCDFLITGENLGQVASQTLDNLITVTDATSLPILRPLLCNDKQETMDLAKEIGTYEISIEPSICCRSVPPNPATKARLEAVRVEENKLDIKKLESESIKTAKIINL